MSEGHIIETSTIPRTRQSLALDLSALGVAPGMTVLVHSSLSGLGWVCGASVTVVQALMDVLTSDGTLVMPTQSGEYSDPSRWSNPPAPESWWTTIRESMPAYVPELTPSRGMGRIAETFRTWPGVMRSAHPTVSFAAWGRHSFDIILNHSLDFGLGEGSPLARIYDLDGSVLLLGVGYDSNTSFHLAECRQPQPSQILEGAPILENGRRTWKTYREIDYDDSTFQHIGAAFEEASSVYVGRVGSATARLFRQCAAVDFAVTWLSSHALKQSAGADHLCT